MGFLDKVKETAAKAGEGVKKGTSSVRDKMEDSQLRKKADENAKQIGYMVVKERTEGESNPAEVDRLAQEIVAIEAKIAEGPEQPVQAERYPGRKSTTGDNRPERDGFHPSRRRSASDPAKIQIAWRTSSKPRSA